MDKNKFSKLRALLKGGQSGLTAGSDARLAGLAAAIGAKTAGSDEDFLDLLAEGRKEAVAERNLALEQEPEAYAAGSLLGTALGGGVLGAGKAAGAYLLGSALQDPEDFQKRTDKIEELRKEVDKDPTNTKKVMAYIQAIDPSPMLPAATKATKVGGKPLDRRIRKKVEEQSRELDPSEDVIDALQSLRKVVSGEGTTLGRGMDLEGIEIKSPRGKDRVVKFPHEGASIREEDPKGKTIQRGAIEALLAEKQVTPKTLTLETSRSPYLVQEKLESPKDPLTGMREKQRLVTNLAKLARDEGIIAHDIPVSGYKNIGLDPQGKMKVYDTGLFTVDPFMPSGKDLRAIESSYRSSVDLDKTRLQDYLEKLRKQPEDFGLKSNQRVVGAMDPTDIARVAGKKPITEAELEAMLAPTKKVVNE